MEINAKDTVNIIGQKDRNVPQWCENFMEEMGLFNGKVVFRKELEKMSFESLIEKRENIMPPKLYKYLSDEDKKDKKDNLRNYSIENLKNNTVYMQQPCEFDDIYDSNIHVEEETFRRGLLLFYCKRCNIVVLEKDNIDILMGKLIKVFISTLCSEEAQKEKDPTYRLYNMLISEYDNKATLKSIELFVGKIRNYTWKFGEWERAITLILEEEYESFCKWIDPKFRVSCFTVTPLSQLMWALYANKHKGFCIEYSLEDSDRELRDSLYPVMYTFKRPDVTEAFINSYMGKSMDEYWRTIYIHGLLQKSFYWGYQNEWRLIKSYYIEENDVSDKSEIDYRLKSFSISKVYLGCRMDYERRKEVIEICEERGIPYVDVVPDEHEFKMKVKG